METILNDLISANEAINKRHTYRCGLEMDTIRRHEDSKLTAFFISQDGQNRELWYELTGAFGYRSSGYRAEYDWRVSKDGYYISYTEGDIAIYAKIV